jgi:hypothetical protein
MAGQRMAGRGELELGDSDIDIIYLSIRGGTGKRSD